MGLCTFGVVNVVIQLALIAAYVFGIIVVVGLCAFFFVLPFESNRKDAVLEHRKVDDASHPAAPHAGGSRTNTFV